MVLEFIERTNQFFTADTGTDNDLLSVRNTEHVPSPWLGRLCVCVPSLLWSPHLHDILQRAKKNIAREGGGFPPPHHAFSVHMRVLCCSTTRRLNPMFLL